MDDMGITKSANNMNNNNINNISKSQYKYRVWVLFVV